MGRKIYMEPDFASSEIDTTKPHPARLYNFYLGGQDNYAVDRAAAAEMLRAVPESRDIARANRAFLQRAVRFLAGEAGIEQFIDIGTGIPAAGSVHEVARRLNPDARVAYADNDPVVHVHASTLLADQPNAGIVLADLRDPGLILSHPKVRELIDFGKPVGLLLLAVLHFVTDEEEPGRIVAALREALCPGSYLVLSHATADFHDQSVADAATAVYRKASAPLVLRDHAQVSAFFEGCEVIDPGVVQVPLWRPDDQPPHPQDLAKIGIYGGVGRLPG
jgi:hypothetical protein